MIIRVVWHCGACLLNGHHDHELPVALDAVQSAAWQEHAALNKKCDDEMDLETFRILFDTLSLTGREMAAAIDARLAGASS